MAWCWACRPALPAQRRAPRPPLTLLTSHEPWMARCSEPAGPSLPELLNEPPPAPVTCAVEPPADSRLGAGGGVFLGGAGGPEPGGRAGGQQADMADGRGQLGGWCACRVGLGQPSRPPHAALRERAQFLELADRRCPGPDGRGLEGRGGEAKKAALYTPRGTHGPCGVLGAKRNPVHSCSCEG